MTTMKSTTITDPSKIGVILDEVHDRWFDEAGIRFDSSQRVLSIRFLKEQVDDAEILGDWWLLRRIKFPEVECFLRIGRVTDYRIEDPEKVGRYDLNTIDYDADRKELRIECGIPFRIVANVTDYEIQLETTDSIVREFKAFSLFGFLFWRRSDAGAD